MKRLEIFRVTNGWIVRDLTHMQPYEYKTGDTSVYQTVLQLQEALPLLLAEGVEEPAVNKVTV